MERWCGKVAVVTGASSGIGADIVRELAGAGLKVAALARRVDNLKKLESELSGSKGEVKAIFCDIRKDDSITEAFQIVRETYGAIHILVNNAGVLSIGPSHSLPNESVRNMFETNIMGLISCTKEGMKLMRGISEGHILNINSGAGHSIPPILGFGVYSATKHGVRVITETLRKEVVSMEEHIRVTSISPGLVDTEMSHSILTEENRSKYKMLPASAISQAIIYAISAPPIVNVSEITIRPARESIL